MYINKATAKTGKEQFGSSLQFLVKDKFLFYLSNY